MIWYPKSSLEDFRSILYGYYVSTDGFVFKENIAREERWTRL